MANYVCPVHDITDSTCFLYVNVYAINSRWYGMNRFRDKEIADADALKHRGEILYRLNLKPRSK